MKIIKYIVAVLGLTVLTANSYAEQTGYEVELIIYEDATRRYIESEDWSYNDRLNQTNDAILNAESLKPDAQFRELSWDGAVLSSALQKIQESPGLNVLLTRRWRQTGLDRDKAYAVEIVAQIPQQAGDTAADNNLSNEEGALTLNQLNSESGAVNAPILPAASINGYVRLVMSRYLHFEVNLEYSRPQLDENRSYVYKSFPVVSERRMKSKEVHYIDHPLVGIIMLATPYKIESATPDNKPSMHKTL